MKKALSSLLVITLLFSGTSIAFATGVPDVEGAVSEISTQEIAFTDDYLNGLSRGTFVPTSYWDLADGNYNATLTVVGVSWLYTNYYFYCNSDGKLNTTMKHF